MSDQPIDNHNTNWEYSTLKEEPTRARNILILAITLMSLIFLYILIRYFKYFAWNNYQHPSGLEIDTLEYNVLSHLDVIGALLGFIGIIVGFFIYYIVKKENEREKTILTNQINGISTDAKQIGKVAGDMQSKLEEIVKMAPDMQKQIGDIVSGANVMQEKIGEIISRVTSLTKIDDLKGRFKAIKGVIDHAESSNNQLTILTYMTSYGAFLVHNIGIAAREEGEELSNIIKTNPDHENEKYLTFKSKDLYNQYLAKLEEAQAEITNKLTNFPSSKIPNSLRIGVLSNTKLNNPEIFKPSKLRSFVISRVLKNKKAFFIRKNNEGYVRINKDKFDENLFVYATKNMPEPGKEFKDYTDEKILEIFCDKLIDKDAELIENLKEKHSHKIFYPLDYIPFQFFLSSPVKRSKQGKWKAVVIFTNYYNIGSGQSTASFETDDKDLCEIFLDVFEKLCEYQVAKEQNPHPLKSIFINSDIIFFMHKENIPNSKLGDLISIADINAKEEFITFFKKLEISYEDKAYYEYDKLSNISRLKRVISIGLFHNKLSEQLLTFNKLCSISRNIDNHLYNLEILQYPNVFSREEKDEFDYAIFARQSLNNRIYYLAGGLSTLGTEQVTIALEDNALDIEKNLLNKNNDFVVVFKIFKHNLNNKPQLLLISQLHEKEIYLTSSVKEVAKV
ncbi:hypothetical protein AHMF7605_29140 [Adhaeribacter arboris]|uniref:Uncharacterized protein n=1 Tax=Adhaeribacter arboris TaxID=2072846 RepID=A0A2T2Y8Y6_9BACT|nr:hypothetical protein [Adhaeribacter arboris]PSR51975.1 hypothetical protein AHMF7605_29140 [Adhaeribacter arboris]